MKALHGAMDDRESKAQEQIVPNREMNQQGDIQMVDGTPNLGAHRPDRAGIAPGSGSTATASNGNSRSAPGDTVSTVENLLAELERMKQVVAAKDREIETKSMQIEFSECRVREEVGTRYR